MSARVIGLDLSMGASGVVTDDGYPATIKPRSTGDHRLVEISGHVNGYCSGADLAVIEEAPPGLKGPAIKAIHMVHGAVRLGLLASGVRYIIVNPTTLKRYATGDARADKVAMALALFKRARLELADDNQVDAWWLRAAGLQLLGEPIVQLPAAQVAALDVVRSQLAGAS